MKFNLNLMWKKNKWQLQLLLQYENYLSDFTLPKYQIIFTNLFMVHKWTLVIYKITSNKFLKELRFNFSHELLNLNIIIGIIYYIVDDRKICKCIIPT